LDYGIAVGDARRGLSVVFRMVFVSGEGGGYRGVGRGWCFEKEREREKKEKESVVMMGEETRWYSIDGWILP
jgi:hypothetical protein